jgi:hypothetical protein
VPKAEVEDLVLEEVPDVEYEDIGGLFRQIEQIRAATPSGRAGTGSTKETSEDATSRTRGHPPG